LETLRCGIAKDGGSKLLIDQDAGLFAVHAARQRCFETVVDHLLCGCDLGRLLWGQRAMPAKHACFK
jgi:hypothetical protein